MALTGRRARFVEEYLLDLNGGRAYERAGYETTGNASEVNASRLLKVPEIQQAIGAAMAERSERTGITQDMVLLELAKIGFSDVRRLFDAETGKLRGVTQLDAETAACVASVEVKRRGKWGEEVATVKLWDKRAALVDMGRHLGMFKEGLTPPPGSEGNPIEIRLLAGSAEPPKADGDDS